MLLESKKRTKNNLFIKNEFKNIDRKVIIFLITFFINLLIYKDEPILIVTPFLVLGYLLGFQYLIIVIMGAFIGSVIFSPLAFYETCLFIVLFLISVMLFKFLKMKVYLRMVISSYLSDLLARYIFEIGIKDTLTLEPLFYSVLSLIISLLIIKISEYLLNEETKQYPYLVVLSILIISSLGLLGLDFEIKGVSILFIVLSIFYLFSMKILDFSIYGCLLFINFVLLLFFNKLEINELFLLFIPCIISSFDKRKYVNLVLYLLGSLLLLLLFKVEFNLGHLITYLIIGISFMLIPSLVIEHIKSSVMNPLNNLELYEKKYQRKEKEIEQELNKFSSLFSLVVQEYDKDNDKRLERKKEDVVYHSLCINCRKNKVCYERDDKLKKLMFKSIESELSEEEVSYINRECLKPSKFFEFSNLFKKDYYREYKYNLEYQSLKEALKSQLNGLSKVLDNFAFKLKLDDSLSTNYENELIKNLLDQNQIDVLYINYFKDLKNNININLCVKITNHQEIYKIKELISNELNLNLEIGEVSKFSIEGYLKIEFKEVKEHKFLHGIYQINCNEEGNGDSYLVYENSNYMIYSLSDGMGSGKNAKEESRFTLKILKSVLDTGMDLRNGIILMNSLLKVKNRYETYATLDLVSINKKNLKSHFFKNGSMHSYIYSSLENRLSKISSSSLPIGIVDNINSYDYSFKLRNGDCILMFSDGIKENIDLMESFFKQVKDYNPQIIAREIAMHFKNEENKDDVSVLVVKIEK